MAAALSAVSDFPEAYASLHRLSLGNVLPSAIIGMLVIYCLKDVDIVSAPFGLPELTAAVSVAVLQWWKRNSLLSILSGTVIYMILIQIAF